MSRPPLLLPAATTPLPTTHLPAPGRPLRPGDTTSSRCPRRPPGASPGAESLLSCCCCCYRGRVPMKAGQIGYSPSPPDGEGGQPPKVGSPTAACHHGQPLLRSAKSAAVVLPKRLIPLAADALSRCSAALLEASHSSIGRGAHAGCPTCAPRNLRL